MPRATTEQQAFFRISTRWPSKKETKTILLDASL
jgi:hypothetical protein